MVRFNCALYIILFNIIRVHNNTSSYEGNKTQVDYLNTKFSQQRDDLYRFLVNEVCNVKRQRSINLKSHHFDR